MGSKTSMKNVEDIYPLSPMQQGILFDTLDAPKSGMYVEQIAWTLRGDVKVPAYKMAWQEVLNRHQILRTAFLWKGIDRPLQIVRQQLDIPWKEYDWRSVLIDERQKRLADFLQEDREQGFELS